MAACNSSGLKDILSPQPESNSMPVTKPMKPLMSTTTPLVSDLTQKLEKASLESKDMALNLVENLGKEKGEFESKIKENGSYLERNNGKEMEEDKGNKQVASRKCFPPPISCLRNVKVGKPFRYLTYDKESGSYVVEEIKIPEGSLFHASREDGRLKLYMKNLDEEEAQGS